MADYYTDFSFAVPMSDEDIEWTKKHYAEWATTYEEQSENFGTIAYDFSENENGRYMWIHSDYGEGDVDAAIDWVQYFFKHRRPDGELGFCWANSCSKPRLGAFSGGGVVLTASKYEFINTDLWVSQHLKGGKHE